MGTVLDLSDLAREGLTGDAGRLEALIGEAEAFFEDQTGFRFASHAATWTLDGTGTNLLVLPQPVISLTSVTVQGTLLAASDYILYNRRPPGPDDRRWPRLTRATATVWDAAVPVIQPIWPLADQTIVIVGTFGFTDLVGGAEVAPVEVRRALVRYVARVLRPREGDEAEAQAGRALRFATGVGGGGVSVSFADEAVSDGPTADPYIDDVLRRYSHARFAQAPVLAFGGA